MSYYDFDATAATETGNAGSKVLDTGVYDAVIVTASKAVASTGTEGIDWSIHVDGSKYANMVYGMWTVNSKGEPIKLNMSKVQALMGITGAKGLTEFAKKIEVQGGTKTVQAYKEFDGKPIKVAVKKILDVYNGEVKEKNEIEAFFAEDGRTYAEIVKGVPSKQIAWYEGKMQDKHTDEYKKFMADGGAEEETAESNDGGSLL